MKANIIFKQNNPIMSKLEHTGLLSFHLGSNPDDSQNLMGCKLNHDPSFHFHKNRISGILVLLLTKSQIE